MIRRLRVFRAQADPVEDHYDVLSTILENHYSIDCSTYQPTGGCLPDRIKHLYLRVDFQSQPPRHCAIQNILFKLSTSAALCQPQRAPPQHSAGLSPISVALRANNFRVVLEVFSKILSLLKELGAPFRRGRLHAYQRRSMQDEVRIVT